jgi:hypothetical protein
MAIPARPVEYEESPADRAYLRTARKFSESAVKIAVAAIGAVIAFLLAMLTLGVRYWIASAPPPAF